MIRNTNASDTEALMSIVESSGQFDPESLDHVRSTLIEYLEGHSSGIWLTADDGEPIGVAYCAPEPVTNGTWNLLMLWTRKDRMGQGHGRALVEKIEFELVRRGMRLLIVETSGLPEFESALAFYARIGFTPEARIRNFFAAGDDKIVLTKPIEQPSPV